jgi:hypothetical protein
MDNFEQWLHANLCCKKWISEAARRRVNRHRNLFANANVVLSQQLDIVKILRNVRNSRTYLRSTMTQKQQIMLNLQK